MSAMAEVIDESIRNMTANMVTKAEQEKVVSVCHPSRCFCSAVIDATFGVPSTNTPSKSTLLRSSPSFSSWRRMTSQ